MRETKADLEKAAAIASAHGHTDIAEELVEREDLDWDEVANMGVRMQREEAEA